MWDIFYKQGKNISVQGVNSALKGPKVLVIKQKFKTF